MSTTTSAQQILLSAPMSGGTEFPEAYWKLIERYRAELVNQAYAILSNRADAEEVAQETFCEAFRHRGKLEQARSLGAWLRAINRAHALNRLHENRRRREAPREREERFPARMATTGGLNVLELREAIARAVDGLPERLRGIVVLHFMEHQSCETIAQKLGLPLGSVHRLLYEAELKLHQRLKKYLGWPTGPQQKVEPPSGEPRQGDVP